MTDDDEGTAEWLGLSIFGTPSWSPDDSRAPTMQPTVEATEVKREA